MGLGVFDCTMLGHVAFALLDDGEQVLERPVIALRVIQPRASPETVCFEKAVEDGEIEVDSATPYAELVELAGLEVLHDPLLEIGDSLDWVGVAAEGFLESFLALPVPPAHRFFVVEKALGNLRLSVESAVEFHLVAVLVEAEGTEAQDLAARLVAACFDIYHQLVDHCAIP